MSCREFEEMAVFELSGDLSPEEARRLQDHLTVCADCRRFTADWKESRSIIQSWKKALPEGEEECLSEIRRNVMKRTRFSGRSISLRQQLKYFFTNPVYGLSVGLFAVVLITTGIGLVSFRQPGNEALPIRQSADLIVPTTSLPSSGVLEIVKGKASTNVFPHSPQISPKKQIRSGSIGRRRAGSTAVAQVSDNSPKTTGPVLSRIELQTADPNIRIIWLAPR